MRCLPQRSHNDTCARLPRKGGEEQRSNTLEETSKPPVNSQDYWSPGPSRKGRKRSSGDIASLSWGPGVASMNSGPAVVWSPLPRPPLPCRQAAGSPQAGTLQRLATLRPGSPNTRQRKATMREQRCVVRAPRHAAGSAGHGEVPGTQLGSPRVGFPPADYQGRGLEPSLSRQMRL